MKPPTIELNNPKNQHIVWLDVVRLIAMFTVVCCHCTDPFNFYPGTAPNIGEIKLWGAIYGAVLRPCVPLFVMITGALLLPVRGDASTFYKKRIPRVFYPFLIWSIIYNLFPWITGLLGLDPKIILDFFPYSGEEVMKQSLSVAIQYILTIPFNFSLLAVHMWYIYLLIGLYLYLPVFSAWVEKASQRAKLMFLLAWGVDIVATLLLSVCFPLLMGLLLLEFFWNVICICRFQRILIVRTLSERSRLEPEENIGNRYSDVCGGVCRDVLWFPLHDSFAGLYGRNVGTLFYLLFSQCGDDDNSCIYVG